MSTTSELKTLCDVCVTSASAVSIVKKLENDKILFIPDCNLGEWVAEQIPEKTFQFIKGGCPTHLRMGEADVMKAKNEHPNAKLLVHPECAPAVTDVQIISEAQQELCPMRRRAKTGNSSSEQKTAWFPIYSMSVRIRCFIRFPNTVYVII